LKETCFKLEKRTYGYYTWYRREETREKNSESGLLCVVASLGKIDTVGSAIVGGHIIE